MVNFSLPLALCQSCFMCCSLKKYSWRVWVLCWWCSCEMCCVPGFYAMQGGQKQKLSPPTDSLPPQLCFLRRQRYLIRVSILFSNRSCVHGYLCEKNGRQIWNDGLGKKKKKQIKMWPADFRNSLAYLIKKERISAIFLYIAWGEWKGRKEGGKGMNDTGLVWGKKL